MKDLKESDIIGMNILYLDGDFAPQDSSLFFPTKITTIDEKGIKTSH